MGKFVVGRGVPDNRTANSTAMQRRGQDAPAAPVPVSPQSRIKIAKREPPNMMPQRRQAGLGGNSQGGGAALQDAVAHCVKCGKGVVPKVDAMMTEENEGPFCRACWAHLWVQHNYANMPNGPQCSMGVRFNRAEWAAINKGIDDIVMEYAKYQTFPPPEAMEQFLTGIKRSKVCPMCHQNIVFTLDLKDLTIPGVNAEWPNDRPLPWQIQQVQQTSAWVQAPVQQQPMMPMPMMPQQPQQQPGMGAPMMPQQMPQHMMPQHPQHISPQHISPQQISPQQMPMMPQPGWPQRR